MTTTEAPAHEPDEDEATGHTSAPSNLDDHHDPLHDIDEMKTVWAVLGTLGAVVFLIWAMSHLFNVMVQVERQKKIGDVEPLELQGIQKEAREELDGKNDKRGSMTIEQAMQAYVNK